ncbi:MAG TPA: NBR1-Ig-like domain-containing protein [Anaerolineales bacterium]|nr:NBR1-Ig-like domain-containing protein [Anaerolineales bacterium]HNO31775.1 NBR1-Ig-like domain-containing protein [Anaerolineales bacterium]
MSKKILLLTAIAVILTACVPAAQPAVDVKAEVNTAVAGTMQVNEQINQAVAETVAAQNETPSSIEGDTVNVAAQVTDTATFTPTVVLAIPSNTPTNTAVPLKYTCSVYKKKPKDNESYNKNAEFDVKFIITNTGTRPWPKGIDFKYNGGTDLAHPKRVEIPVALQPGQSYEVVLDGKAPDKRGNYVMSWLVDGPMCTAYIAIKVK